MSGIEFGDDYYTLRGMKPPGPSGPDVDALVERLTAAYNADADCIATFLDDLDSLAALARSAADMEEALERVLANAESWHGPVGDDNGHARALAVIAKWCRDALAAVRSREQQEPQA